MLGFYPISGGAIDSLSPPATPSGTVFSLGTVGCASGCGCGSCTFLFDVTNECLCPVSGAVIDVYDHMGGTLLYTCTTNSMGLCLLSEIVTGTYYVTVTATGYITYTSSVTMTCSGGLAVQLQVYAGVTQVFCCHCCLLPLITNTATGTYLTDANGTYQMSYWDGPGGPLGTTTIQYLYVYTTCSNANVTLPYTGIPCMVCTRGSGSAGLLYAAYCSTTTPFMFTVLRYWKAIQCPYPGGSWGYSPDYPFTHSVYCEVDPVAQASVAVPGGLSSCTPFVFSSALTTTGSPPLSDPVGGTVVIQS